MDQTNIEGSKFMITDKLFDEIKTELVLLRADIMLINHDLTKVREQLDRIERNAHAQAQEPIGLAPGTPPPDFLPPEIM